MNLANKVLSMLSRIDCFFCGHNWYNDIFGFHRRAICLNCGLIEDYLMVREPITLSQGGKEE